jgi:hypothetical protein
VKAPARPWCFERGTEFGHRIPRPICPGC